MGVLSSTYGNARPLPHPPTMVLEILWQVGLQSHLQTSRPTAKHSKLKFQLSLGEVGSIMINLSESP